MTIFVAEPSAVSPDEDVTHEPGSDDELPEDDMPEADAEVAEVEVSPSCPCEVEDWRCWSQHREVCNRERQQTGTSPNATERSPDELSDKAARPKHVPEPVEDTKSFEPERHGAVVAVRAGYLGCTTKWCRDHRGGVLGGLELGYRHGFVAGLISVDGGVGAYRADDDFTAQVGDTEGSFRFFDMGIGAALHFVRTGRIDPWVSARIGYTRVAAHIRGASGQVKVIESVSRGGVRLGGGLPFSVAPRVSVGPRFDVTLPFAGTLCLEIHGPQGSSRECSPVRKLEERLMVDSSGMPIPWSITLDVRLVFGSI